jgi:hypothetical protein
MILVLVVSRFRMLPTEIQWPGRFLFNGRQFCPAARMRFSMQNISYSERSACEPITDSFIAIWYVFFFFFFFFYSCCSHLEHRVSVKRLVSLQFLNLRQSAGLPGRGISPSQGRYLYTEHKHRINAHRTDNHALNGIRTHYPSVWANEDPPPKEP